MCSEERLLLDPELDSDGLLRADAVVGRPERLKRPLLTDPEVDVPSGFAFSQHERSGVLE